MRQLKQAKTWFLAPGFSLIEIMIVMFIVTILSMIAIPNLMNHAARQQVRTEAMNAATVMRQARLKAAVAQKPVRVVVDCAKLPCIMRSQLGKYSQGEIVGWADIAGTHRILDSNVRVIRSKPIGANPDGGSTQNGITWIIFATGGKALSNPRPFNLYFYNTVQHSASAPGWGLSVNNDSGRATLNRVYQPVN